MPAMANAPYWYIGSTRWSAVTAWTASTAKTAGALVRQNAAPTLGNERVFVCVVAGTTGGGEPSWSVGKGTKTSDNSATWQECTGQPAVNGDVTNTLDWNSAKSNSVALGKIIKNIAATHFFICTTLGTAGSGAEPSWNTTAGTTTTDGTVVWTCIGAVGAFGAWAAPHSRLPNAVNSNWGASGDTFYISSSHAESQSTNWAPTMVGLASAPSYYLCVDDSIAPPTTLATTATISGGGIVTLAGGDGIRAFYMYGVTFNCGSGAANVSMALQGPSQVFEKCNFNLLTTSSDARIIISQAASVTRLSVLRSCTFSFASASQSIRLDNGGVELIDCSIAETGTAPTTAITLGGVGNFLARDCDLSGVTSNLIDVASGGVYDCIFANCRLGAGVTLNSGTIGWPGAGTLRVHNCDSGATNYRMYTDYFWGTSQHNTSTFRDDGATDGTTPISWQIDSNANPYFEQPFFCEQIFQWVDTTGVALTATVEIAGSTTLYDDEVWMEIEYLGNASYPIGSLANCRKSDVFSTRSAIPSSSATWTGSPAVTQKLEVSFTPQMKGPIKARVYVAKKDATVYVDPLIAIA